MYRAFITILITMALTGCVVAWGGAYKIDSQTPDTVTIKYDGTFIASNEIQKVAQATCDEYGKDAVKQEETMGMWRLRTVSFLCAKR